MKGSRGIRCRGGEEGEHIWRDGNSFGDAWTIREVKSAVTKSIKGAVYKTEKAVAQAGKPDSASIMSSLERFILPYLLLSLSLFVGIR